MEQEQREAIKKASRNRGGCPKCNGFHVEKVDGGTIGGMPGIMYKVCRVPAPAAAIVSRPKRGKI